MGQTQSAADTYDPIQAEVDLELLEEGQDLATTEPSFAAAYDLPNELEEDSEASGDEPGDEENTGVYWGTSFRLGGQVLRTADTGEFLAGSVGDVDVSCPPKMYPTTPAQALVNVHASSLSLQKKGSGGSHVLKGTFDCLSGGRLCIWLGVSEKLDDTRYPAVLRHEDVHGATAPCASLEVSPGYGQKLELPFDLNSLPSNQCLYDPRTDRIPLAILLEVDECAASQIGKQLTYCELMLTQDEAEPVVSVFKVKVNLDCIWYIAHSIYGIEGSSKDPCIVCLDEDRQVVVLPCRHLCLCKDCADIYRHKTLKCPICRCPLSNLALLKDPLPLVIPGSSGLAVQAGAGGGKGEMSITEEDCRGGNIDVGEAGDRNHVAVHQSC